MICGKSHCLQLLSPRGIMRCFIALPTALIMINILHDDSLYDYASFEVFVGNCKLSWYVRLEKEIETLSWGLFYVILIAFFLFSADCCERFWPEKWKILLTLSSSNSASDFFSIKFIHAFINDYFEFFRWLQRNGSMLTSHFSGDL